MYSNYISYISLFKSICEITSSLKNKLKTGIVRMILKCFLQCSFAYELLLYNYWTKIKNISETVL